MTTQPCTIYVRLPRLRLSLPSHNGRPGRRVKLLDVGYVTLDEYNAIVEGILLSPLAFLSSQGVEAAVTADVVRVESEKLGLDVMMVPIASPTNTERAHASISHMHEQLHDMVRSIPSLDRYRDHLDYSVEEYVPHMTLEYLNPGAKYIGTWGRNCEQVVPMNRIFVDWGDLASVSIEGGCVYEEQPW